MNDVEKTMSCLHITVGEGCDKGPRKITTRQKTQKDSSPPLRARRHSMQIPEEFHPGDKKDFI